MWVWYEIFCDEEPQKRLYEDLRQSIGKWRFSDYIGGVVITYHFGEKPSPSDSLYFCADVKDIEGPEQSTLYLTDDIIQKIPIDKTVRSMCQRYAVAGERIQLKDYWIGVNKGKYREGADKEIEYAARGTELALTFLDLGKSRSGQPITQEYLDGFTGFITEALDKIHPLTYYGCGQIVHYVCNSAFAGYGLSVERYLLAGDVCKHV